MGLLTGLVTTIKKVGSAAKETVLGVLGSGFSVSPGIKAKAPTVSKVIETVANHPFLTAGAVTAAVAPAATLAVARTAATKVVKEFAALPTAKQAAYGAVGIVGGSALISSPKAAKAAINAPSSLSNFGANIGGLIENPSLEAAKKIVKENPILTGGAAIAGGAALLGGAGTLANVLVTRGNTIATQENTNLKKGADVVAEYKEKLARKKEQKALKALVAEEEARLKAPVLSFLPPEPPRIAAPAVATVAEPPAEKPAEVLPEAIKPKKKPAKKKKKAAKKKKKPAKRKKKPAKRKKKPAKKKKKPAKRKTYKAKKRKKRKK